MRYFARISYDGSHFEGFQRLKNGRGVQNEIEHVLSILAHHEVNVKGAGRTDRGVHALDQCIHFDFDLDISVSKLKYVLNRMLSKYIAVRELEVVSSDFHARHSVRKKTYVYKVYRSEKNPFLEDYTYPYYQEIDLDKMRECSMVFLGAHSFHNFVSGERDNYDSEIFAFDIKEEGDYLLFTLEAKSFYRYMVRSIVGAVMDVGSGRSDIKEVQDALASFSKKQFSIVPPQGLYLTKIEY